jgi:protein-tyrosine phosphatase
MRTELFRVASNTPGRLAIAPRPRGGDWLGDELAAWRRAGTDVIVSLLTPSEVTELDLADEPDLSAAHGMTFVSFPIPDYGVPTSPDAFAELAARVARHLADGQSTLVYCRQGIGRAGLLATAVLRTLGLDSTTAVRTVTAARGRPVPETPEQLHWVHKFAPAHTKTGS